MIKDLAQEVQGTTMVERPVAPAPEVVPDPEVEARPKRRRFTAEYKLRVLRQADACKEPGEIGTLLRREGLYSSHLVHWRRQREEAAQPQLKSRRRGPKPKLQDPRMKQLERENARLQRQLKRVALLLDIQEKAGEILKNLDDVEND